MELYILDDLLRRVEVIDRFDSLIWTERYSTTGDFELQITSSREVRSLLAEGRRVAVNESRRVMTIETVEDKATDDGRSLLTVKGPSIEDILADRSTRNPIGNGVLAAWNITNTPAAVLRQLFDAICVTNANLADRLPFYTPGNIYPADTITEPTNTVSVDIGEVSLLDAFKQIADPYALGFRLVRGLDDSKLYFNVFTGSNRTSAQTIYDPVIFSQELDTIGEITELTSIADYKNVAYVFAANGSRIVSDNGSESATGFERHVLVVSASDIDLPAGVELQAALQTKGVEALANQDGVRAVDGQSPQNSKFKYGIHYELGDVVELRSRYGSVNNMRVTEQIFVSDEQGDRSYPTLAAETFITPGSWYGIDSQLVWDDFLDKTWNDL